MTSDDVCVLVSELEAFPKLCTKWIKQIDTQAVFEDHKRNSSRNACINHEDQTHLSSHPLILSCRSVHAVVEPRINERFQKMASHCMQGLHIQWKVGCRSFQLPVLF